MVWSAERGFEAVPMSVRAGAINRVTMPWCKDITHVIAFEGTSFEDFWPVYESHRKEETSRE